MVIDSNKIIFPSHVVVCDPGCASADYVEMMADLLMQEATEPSPREHARVLRHHNNDGTWGIKQHNVH
jgi:hypothetical protein